MERLFDEEPTGQAEEADALAPSAAAGAPLAARLRPRSLDEIVGQRSLLGPGAPLRSAIEGDRLRSVVLWGPPGVGKTTLASVVAASTEAAFEQLSAVTALPYNQHTMGISRSRRQRPRRRRRDRGYD